MAPRSALTRLLSVAAVVLEQNMEIMESDRFQRWQRERMTDVASELEKGSTKLERGQGLRLLHRVQLMVAAYHPFAEPKGSLAFSLHDPDFAGFRIDLEKELEAFVRTFLRA